MRGGWSPCVRQVAARSSWVAILSLNPRSYDLVPAGPEPARHAATPAASRSMKARMIIGTEALEGEHPARTMQDPARSAYTWFR